MENERNFSYENVETPNEVFEWIQNNIEIVEEDSVYPIEAILERGMCNAHSIADLIVNMLSAINIKAHKIFAVEYCMIEPYRLNSLTYHVDTEDVAYMSLFRHTFVFYEFQGRFYWVNNAWEMNHGIVGAYASVQGICRDIKQAYKDSKEWEKCFYDLELIEFDTIIDEQTTVSEYTQSIIYNSDSEAFTSARIMHELSIPRDNSEYPSSVTCPFLEKKIKG